MPWPLWLHIARSAWEAVWASRLRGALSALGVVVGVCGVVTVLGVISGLDRAFSALIDVMGPGNLYVSERPMVATGAAENAPSGSPVRPEEAAYLEERIVEARAVVPFDSQHIDGTSPVVVELGGERLQEVDLIGATANWLQLGAVVQEGRFFSPMEVNAVRPVAVVGAELGARMAERGVTELTVNGLPLQVVGVIKPRGSTIYGTLDNFIVLPLGLFGRFFGTERSLTVGVVARDPSELPRLEEAVTIAMRSYRRLTPERDNNFSLSKSEQARALYRQLTAALYGASTALALLVLLVSGGGIVNVMLVGVVERTREIGVLQALGARPSGVLAQFLLEAVIISGSGSLIGVALGAAIARLISMVSPLPAAVDLAGAVAGMAFGVLTGVVCGLLPAVRAARLLPAVALRAG